MVRVSSVQYGSTYDTIRTIGTAHTPLFKVIVQEVVPVVQLGGMG